MNNERIPKTPDLKAGLVFTSVHWRGKAEIVRIDPKANTLDVIMESPTGDRWPENGWNLQHTKWAFEKGEYSLPVNIPDNITLW